MAPRRSAAGGAASRNSATARHAATPAAATAPPSRWILTPWQDLLLFVGTPALVLPVALVGERLWTGKNLYAFVNLAMAAFVGSTAALLNFVAKDSAKAFIVATEAGILHQMRRRRPDAELIPAPADSGSNCSLCPYMKLNNLEKLYLCLRDLQPEIRLDETVRRKALQPLERMLALG